MVVIAALTFYNGIPLFQEKVTGFQFNYLGIIQTQQIPMEACFLACIGGREGVSCVVLKQDSTLPVFIMLSCK